MNITENQLDAWVRSNKAEPGGLWVHSAVAEALYALRGSGPRDRCAIAYFHSISARASSSGSSWSVTDEEKRLNALRAAGFSRLASSLDGVVQGYARRTRLSESGSG